MTGPTGIVGFGTGLVGVVGRVCGEAGTGRPGCVDGLSFGWHAVVIVATVAGIAALAFVLFGPGTSTVVITSISFAMHARAVGSMAALQLANFVAQLGSSRPRFPVRRHAFSQ